MRSLDLPFALRLPRWPLILAGLVAVVLVLGIQQVVRQAVHDGDVRRQAVAVQARDMWRCNLQRGKDRRDTCRAQANASPRDEAKPLVENALASAFPERSPSPP